ncbi:MAG: PilN domain-containing protein [Synergistaceae bacterium]|nr:PilN domain-containing protein [Synergistaceae bacterium]
MVVKLDLRIPGKHNLKLDEPDNSLKHYLLFSAAAAFFVIVSAVILLGSWKIYSTSTDIKRIEDRKSSVVKSTELMDKELARLNGESVLIDEKLEFMLAEIPSIELMTGLDLLMPQGLVLDSLLISKGKAVFGGIAMDEEDIMTFVDRLSNSRIVLAVDVPVIKNSKLKKYNVRSFTITCTLRSMREILKGNVFSGRDESTVSGDEAL